MFDICFVEKCVFVLSLGVWSVIVLGVQVVFDLVFIFVFVARPVGQGRFSTHICYCRIMLVEVMTA